MRFLNLIVLIWLILTLSACTSIGGGDSTSVPTVGIFTPFPTSPTEVGGGVGTPTLEVTKVSDPTPTGTVSVPSTPTIVPTPMPRFMVQPGTPKGTENFVNPEIDCNWMGIGGQVFDADGVPVDGLIVELGGTIAGTEISFLAITGNAPVFGPGGYIIELGNTPVASEGTLWLQLLSEGEPQSEKILLATSAECEQNLLLVNFTESHTVSGIQVRLPIIIK